MLGQSLFEKKILQPIERQPFLKFSMLNLFSIVSMYIDQDNPSNLLDLSLQIFIPRMYDASLKSFMENCDDNQIFIFCNAGMSFSIKRISSTYKIRNTITELLTHLYMQGSSPFLMKLYILIILSKCMFQLQDACLSP